MMHYQIIASPMGDVAILADNQGICEVAFMQGKAAALIQPEYNNDLDKAPTHLVAAIEQLQQYFLGQRTAFDLPLSQQGTAFQQRVWQQLTQIPSGQTYSYGQLANAIDNPKAVRAVGTANGANKIAIIVPCHRVIGSDKKLTGYAGGIGIKAKLLMLEGAHFKV